MLFARDGNQAVAMKWRTAFFKTSGPAQVSVRACGKEIQRLELPTGVTISICHEGEAESSGFEEDANGQRRGLAKEE
jgi:hypothetical protein